MKVRQLFFFFSGFQVNLISHLIYLFLNFRQIFLGYIRNSMNLSKQIMIQELLHISGQIMMSKRNLIHFSKLKNKTKSKLSLNQTYKIKTKPKINLNLNQVLLKESPLKTIPQSTQQQTHLLFPTLIPTISKKPKKKNKKKS